MAGRRGPGRDGAAVCCRRRGTHAARRGSLVGTVWCGGCRPPECLAGARDDARNAKPPGCGRGLHVLGDAEDRGGDRDVGDRYEGCTELELAGAAGDHVRVHQDQLGRAAVARPAFEQEGVATTWQLKARRTLPPQVNTSFTICSTCRTSTSTGWPISRSSTSTRLSSRSWS